MSKLIEPRRPRGRPKVDRDAPLVSVSTGLPLHQYDRLLQSANAQRKSVAALTRELLQRHFPTEK